MQTGAAWLDYRGYYDKQRPRVFRRAMPRMIGPPSRGGAFPESRVTVVLANLHPYRGGATHTEDYKALCDSQLATRKMTLRPFPVKCWSRYTQIVDAVKDS